MALAQSSHIPQRAHYFKLLYITGTKQGMSGGKITILTQLQSGQHLALIYYCVCYSHLCKSLKTCLLRTSERKHMKCIACLLQIFHSRTKASVNFKRNSEFVLSALLLWASSRMLLLLSSGEGGVLGKKGLAVKRKRVGGRVPHQMVWKEG